MQSDFACNLILLAAWRCTLLTRVVSRHDCTYALSHPIEPMQLAFDFGSCKSSDKYQ